jgi:hypothetical protein
VEYALLPLVHSLPGFKVPGPLVTLPDQLSNSYQLLLLLPPPEDSGAVAVIVFDCPLGTKVLVGFTLGVGALDGLPCPLTVRKHP